MTFTELRLAEPIVRAVASEGYSAPTPIQVKAIPEALAGRDVLGCAQTGTGKTCAFALPILQRLSGVSADQPQPKPAGRAGRRPRALVLCPTRELATQIFDSFASYGRNLPLRHTVVFGGVNQHRQVRAMQAGVDVLVATPGRLLDLINQGHIDLRSIEVLVLDEADRMLDMGFINDIRKIVAMIPKERQTLFFSATVSKDIRRLAESILRNPVSVETAPEATTVETISQRVYMIDKRKKPALLEHLLREEGVERTLVFTRTKHGADRVKKSLLRAGIQAEAIHGNKSQNARTRAMNGFRSGSTRVLIATDIASRGIDVDDISHVVNFDMPVDPETYVHRIGRTARAGASGVAYSFCDREEMPLLRDIERRARIRLAIAEEIPNLPDAPARDVRDMERDQEADRSRTGRGGKRAPQRRRTTEQDGGERSRGSRGSGGRGKPADGASGQQGQAQPGKKKRRRQRSGAPVAAGNGAGGDGAGAGGGSGQARASRGQGIGRAGRGKPRNGRGG